MLFDTKYCNYMTCIFKPMGTLMWIKKNTNDKHTLLLLLMYSNNQNPVDLTTQFESGKEREVRRQLFERSKARLSVKLLRQLTKWSGGAERSGRGERPEMGARRGCEVTVSTSGLINNAAGL